MPNSSCKCEKSWITAAHISPEARIGKAGDGIKATAIHQDLRMGKDGEDEAGVGKVDNIECNLKWEGLSPRRG
jgi:hypothetical protein